MRARIAVFLDSSLSYDRTKDVQAIGACIQNMLLKKYALGLGAVWLGEILKNGTAVRELLKVRATMVFMALIAQGYTSEKNAIFTREITEEVIFANYREVCDCARAGAICRQAACSGQWNQQQPRACP